MKCLVVIITYRAKQLTLDCLESVAPEARATLGLHVTLVENGTDPQHVAFFQDELTKRGWLDEGWLSYTHTPVNLGFTGGNNFALDPAFDSENPPDYAMLLNNDTLVHPGVFKHLIDFMDANPKAGVAGSRLEHRDGSAQVSAFRFMSARSEFETAFRLGLASKVLSKKTVRQPIPEDNIRTDWVSGASFIFRREVVKDIGTLDADYYTYYDDIDYCRSADRAGWETWYVPASRVIHLIGQTTGITDAQTPERAKRRPQYWFDARRRFFLKHHGRFGAALCDAAFIVGYALWRVRRVIQRKPDTDPQFYLRDFIRNSVFFRGFKPVVVPNPAMEDSA